MKVIKSFLASLIMLNLLNGCSGQGSNLNMPSVPVKTDNNSATATKAKTESLFSTKTETELQQWYLRKINTVKMSGDVFKNEVKVAVIDTGVDTEHPMLKANLLPLIDMWHQEGLDDKFMADGTLNDYSGRDGKGHGTHIAGIISSVANYSGNGKIRIMPVKAFNHEGRTSDEVLGKAIIKAVEMGADVINLSIGGPGSESNPELRKAVRHAYQKGVVIVSSAGNNSNRWRKKISAVNIPAAFPEVISVGAVNRDGLVADYSNGGPEIDLVAPGGENIAGYDNVKVSSAWPLYPTAEEFKHGFKGPEVAMAGTSVATGFVSAAAALILSQNNDLTPDQVREKLIATADDIYADGFDNTSGYGLLNLGRVLGE